MTKYYDIRYNSYFVNYVLLFSCSYFLIRFSLIHIILRLFPLLSFLIKVWLYPYKRKFHIVPIIMNYFFSFSSIFFIFTVIITSVPHCPRPQVTWPASPSACYCWAASWAWQWTWSCSAEELARRDSRGSTWRAGPPRRPKPPSTSTQTSRPPTHRRVVIVLCLLTYPGTLWAFLKERWIRLEYNYA